MLGVHLSERTRIAIGKARGQGLDSDINDLEYINFIQENNLEAVALLLPAWFEEIPEGSPQHLYSKRLAEFADQQDNQVPVLEVMRTNVLFDHRAHYLKVYTRLLHLARPLLEETHDKREQSASVPPDRNAALVLSEQANPKAKFVYLCVKYRTCMEEIAPKHHENERYKNNTQVWTAYWTRKVNEAKLEQVGPIWKLLQSERYPEDTEAESHVRGAGTQLYSRLCKPIHGEENQSPGVAEYLYELQKKIAPIIEQLHDDRKKN